MNEWYIDICFKDNLNFSKNLKKRKRKDLVFERAILEISEFSEIVNSEQIDFTKKETQDMFTSFDTEDEKIVIEYQKKISDTFKKYGLVRYLYLQRD